MDYEYLLGLLSAYGIPSVAIGVLVAVVSFILDKLLTAKLNKSIKAYIPFIAGTLFYFVFSVIFFGFENSLKSEVLYSGACSGSLGILIKTTLKRIFKGKTDAKSQTAILIEGIICDYVSQNLSIAVTAIEAIITETSPEETDNLTEYITEALLLHSDNNDKDELYRIASVLIQAVKTLKNQP